VAAANEGLEFRTAHVLYTTRPGMGPDHGFDPLTSRILYIWSWPRGWII
jgi:hypothetical protein